MLQREETSACATSSLATCSDDFKSPDNKLQYSNVRDCEFGDFFSFLFFFFVNACRSNHTHAGASSSRDNISHGRRAKLSHVFQTFVWRPCLLRADHREFSVP